MKTTIFKKNQSLIFGGIVLIATLLLVFGRLDILPIQLWDESRLTFNAIEMSKSNNWWVTTFDGQPDMWNTKPPLLIWMQALCIKMIGLNPIAIRLPVAIAVFLTVIAVFKFVLKQTGHYVMGLFAVLVLITTQGYLAIHVARTGDFDGLLILFTTLSSFAFFDYSQTQKAFKLYLFFIYLSLAVLTKSIAGLLFAPGIVIYLVSQKQFLSMLKNKHFYFGFIIFLIPIISFYAIREHYNPGYIKAVFENEIGGRFLNTIEQHDLPFSYYFELIFEKHFQNWILLSFIGFGFSISNVNASYNKIGVFLFIISLSFLLTISMSKTKLEWYEAPIYPFVSILVAIAIYQGILFIKIKSSQLKIWNKIIPSAIILLLFSYPIYKTINREVIEAKGLNENQHEYALSRFIINTNENDLENLNIVSDNYIPHVDFYIFMKQANGIKLKHISSIEIKDGDRIATDNNDVKTKIQKLYNHKVTYDYDNVKMFEIINKKDTTYVD